MNKLKSFVLRQFDHNHLSKEDGFDLLRELAEAELAHAAPPATASPAALPTAALYPGPDTALAPAPLPARGDVAVVGLGCRLPGARGPAEFWDNLCRGVDSVTPFPRQRLDDVVRVKRELWQSFHTKVRDPQRDLLHGGWLDGVDRFDAPFFDVSPADARTMGPAERLFLETAWEALEAAGYTRAALRGSNTGVYLAHSPEVPFEYARLLPSDDPQAVPFNIPGSTGYRLSYWLDLRGPTMVVNTTCSSSLVAVHQACAALRAGDCDLALAGGISLFVFPFFHDTSDPLRLRSPDGRCKAFSAAADGLSMGEGLGLVVLKPLAKAEADGDVIYAVIKGGAVNSDGRSNGLTAPSPAAQTDVLLRAWRNAGVDPESIGYVEAHGAGTQLGDPIEVKGLTDAFRTYTPQRHFCALGSVKTNVSHLGDAAGVAGLLKTVLSLHHRTLPPSLHFERPNPLIPFEKSPLYVNAELKPWAPAGGPRRAGVSSFGISGTNAHVVLEEYAPAPLPAGPQLAAPCLLPVSARSLGALWRLLARYEARLGEGDDATLDALCQSAAHFRDHYEYRVAVVGSSRDEVRQKLARLSQLRHLERLPPAFAAQGIYAARVAGRQSEAYSDLPPDEAPAGALVRAYLTEDAVDWGRFFPPPARKATLPAYAFDAARYWPEHEVLEDERYDDYFFDLRWVPRPLPGAGAAPRQGTWLVLGDQSPLCRELVERLRTAGCPTSIAHTGEGFAATGPDEYIVDPADTEDYERLVDEVTRAHPGPLAGVLHLWTCRPPDDAMASLEGVTRSQDTAALGMYRLARALMRQRAGQDADMFVVSAYTQAVDGSEPATSPARVTTFGFSKVLSQETPLVAVCAIDVDIARDEPPAVARALFAELCVERERRDELVAYRGGHRYVQELDRSTPSPDETKHPALRQGGVYLIAGGTGYLGLEVGKHLARQAKAKIVLVGRTKLPPRERWAEARRTEPAGSPLAERMAGVEAMEALGAEVLCLAADVTDPLQLGDAVDRARAHFGRIDGVMVAMKHLYHKPIAELTEDEFRTGLMNRVRGTWLLDSLTRQDDLDFFLLFSSISSIMGTKTASECCAVNQYLDAYASYGRAQGRRVSSMNLTLILDDRRDFRGPTPIPPLSFREFLGCFDHFLRRLPPLAVVSKFDRDEVQYLLPVLRIPFSDALLASLGVSRAPSPPVATPPDARPAAPAAFDEVLGALRGAWRELLGQEPEDDEQSFFQAGGTSLSALKLVNLVRQTWAGVPFEPADVFAHSTLEAMAAHIASGLGAPQAATSAAAPTSANDRLERALDGVENGELSVEAALSALHAEGNHRP